MLKSLFGSSSNPYSFSTVKNALKENTFSLESFLSNVTFEILTVVETSEEDRGKTIFWLLAREAGNHPEYFVAVWQKFQQQITLEDILVSPLQGHQQGQTILWLLVATCSSQNLRPFNLVWEKFNSAFNLLTLTMPTAGGNGLSTVELFFNVGYFMVFSIFEKFWQRFSSELRAHHLSSSLADGVYKGVNLLWFLAAFAFQGKPRFFEEIWQKEKDFFSYASLTLRPEDLTQNNCTILWFLAFVAGQKKSPVFFEVWDKMKRELIFSDITNPLSTTDKVSLIRVLITFQEGKQVVLEMLTQMPGIANENTLKEVREISSEVVQFSQSIFAAKQKLYSHLDYLKKRKLLGIVLTDQEISTLLQLGEEASQAGYVNANYEVYSLLEGDKWQEIKSLAWSRIPANSWFRALSPEEEANFYVSLAARAATGFFRETYLQTALYWTSKIRGKNRIQLIDVIAYYFITGKSDYDPARPYLAPRLAANVEDLQHIELLSFLMVLKEQADYTNALESPTRSLLTLAPNASAAAAAACAAPTLAPMSAPSDAAASLEISLATLSLRKSSNK